MTLPRQSAMLTRHVHVCFHVPSQQSFHLCRRLVSLTALLRLNIALLLLSLRLLAIVADLFSCVPSSQILSFCLLTAFQRNAVPVGCGIRGSS